MSGRSARPRRSTPLWGLAQRLCATLALTLALGACSTLPPGVEQPRAASHALGAAQATATTLGRQLAPQATAHQGLSGFRMLTQGIAGYAARQQLIARAERSLDLQYFIFHCDTTGGQLALALLQAADRGVQVRLLLDDGDIAPGDEQLALLSAHAGIALRYFNPLVYRGSNPQRRAIEMLLGLRRLDYRMHNKLMVADNSLALMGGRNVGDAYFQVDSEGQLADDDMVVAGPAVARLSASFDEFWNSALAIPNEALLHARPSPAALQALRDQLQAKQLALRAADPPFMQLARSGQPLAGVLDGSAPLIWSRWRLVYDTPYKQQIDRGERVERVMVEPVADVAAEVRQELLVVTPYFVPTARERSLLKDLAGRGVQVRVLTNSLESTDEVAAQAGYARHRLELLQAGVALYELRASPTHERGTGQPASMSAKGNLGLHAKLLVFDRRRAFVGSMNMDHRSAHLNTEIGLIVESPELAAQTAARFEALTLPGNAWRVERVDPATMAPQELDMPGPATRAAGLLWRTERDGRSVETTLEPARSAWQRTQLALWMLLPLDAEL